MDLIRRSELLSVFKRWERVPDYNEAERHIIKAAIYEAESIPAVDAVERAVYEQIVWERDIAVKQLADIGKSLGEKMDDDGRYELVDVEAQNE